MLKYKKTCTIQKMVSILHKELECTVEKFKLMKLEVLQPKIKNNLLVSNMIRTFTTWINHIIHVT